MQGALGRNREARDACGSQVESSMLLNYYSAISWEGEMVDTSNLPQNVSPQERMILRRIELSATHIGRLINILSIISGVIALIIVLSVVIIAVTGSGPIPSELSNWGGIVLGFYFGQFVNLVKDYMGIINAVDRAPGVRSDPSRERSPEE